MKNNESLNVFLRLLQEIHNNLKKDIEELLSKLASENKKDKSSCNDIALTSANSLMQLLTDHDKPQWLKNVVTFLERYSSSPDARNSNIILLK